MVEQIKTARRRLGRHRLRHTRRYLPFQRVRVSVVLAGTSRGVREHPMSEPCGEALADM
ncbi:MULTISPECIES: hypothetical protein [unclassified Marinovum]|uniref:hypothetical protein n=1 Tax=unclassified Marinovum TaxID=2647166 RepID=UPI003EDC842B